MPGYILVRDEPPYERVAELGRSVAIAEGVSEPGAGENPEGTSRPRRKR